MKKIYTFLFLVIVVVLIGVTMALTNRDKTRHYRGMEQVVSKNRAGSSRCRVVNFENFQQLHSHGSGLINFLDFKKHFPYPTAKLYVINLLEDDIYYYNNRCLWWYGLEYTPAQLGKILEEKPNRKFGKFFVRLIYGYPPVDDASKLQTEGEIFRSMGAQYFVPLKNHDNWLGDWSYMDDVIRIFEQVPEDGHLYIHCKNGRGRTSTFLILHDIFKNAKKMSLDDIVNRHYCVGREDLYNTTVWRGGNWTREGLEARKALIESFYAYMSSPQGYPHRTWAQWTAQNGAMQKNIQVHR